MTSYLSFVTYPLPENALLCSIDVVSLYPSIPNDQGVNAMKEALNTREDQSVSTESLVDLAEIVLKNNYFEHMSDVYRQIKGTAIGTKFAPQYAILYMGAFEEGAINAYEFKPWVWWRYIDDIFLIWQHGEEEFLKFMAYLNSIDPNIKFTYKYSEQCIEFLDVLVKREGSTLSTDLFVKETDAHQFLHFDSCHPFHTKKAIPFSQALRMKRICSDNESFERRISDLKHCLTSRGHKDTLVDAQIDKARAFDREALLSEVSERISDNSKVYLVLTYHPALSRNIYDILKNNHNILHINGEHRRVFECLPVVSFRRAKTLKDVLVRSKLKSGDFQQGSCNRCNRSNCLVDNFMDTSDTFTNADADRVFALRKGALYCNSKYVVYKLRCNVCTKQYVGSTITTFRTRFNNYKSQFRKYSKRKQDCNPNPGKDIKQASLFEHFCSDGHHGLDDWSFQLIDQADSEIRLRERESFWQHKLDTFVPRGLNEREVPT